jgi:hypothetical protein
MLQVKADLTEEATVLHLMVRLASASCGEVLRLQLKAGLYKDCCAIGWGAKRLDSLWTRAVNGASYGTSWGNVW